MTTEFGMLCMTEELKLLRSLRCSNVFQKEQDVSNIGQTIHSTTRRRVSLHLVFLDHLLNEIISWVTKNEERFLVAYLLPAKWQGLTADITDRLYDAYKSDLPSKVEFVDEITRWRFRENLSGVDTGSKKTIDLLNETNNFNFDLTLK